MTREENTRRFENLEEHDLIVISDPILMTSEYCSMTDYHDGLCYIIMVRLCLFGPSVVCCLSSVAVTRICFLWALCPVVPFVPYYPVAVVRRARILGGSSF
jgi:hypothetical protein